MDDVSINQAEHIYVMLNKPRGLVTSASDELGRETVFACFENSKLPHLSPVGRLGQSQRGHASIHQRQRLGGRRYES
jgi:23S rRNA pseudouridine2605 synthase